MIARRHTLVATAAAAAAGLAAPARAQPAWPSRPLRLIVAFAPGGFNDTIGRYVAAGLTTALGQPVVVDNRAGGGGVIGSEAGARAAPDGYTLLVASVPHVVNAALHSNLPYDPVGDFEAVSLLGSNPNLLIVHPSVPARSVAELVALVRANPGKYSYASNSIGGSSHLGMEMFRRAAGGLDIVHVPYRGSAPAMADLLTGTVHMTIDNIVFQAPFVRDGRLRALAQTGRTRNAMFPDLPTIAESGYPGFENVSWYLILAPKGTPRPIVDRLSAEIAKVLRGPDAAERLTGADLVGGTPDQAAAYLRTQYDTLTRLAREIGARAD
jgi:tripartite-type tricarboxylate transporter receptor subunit TctC